MKKKRLLVIEPLHERAMALLRERSDVEFEVITDVSEENLLSKIGSADAITLRLSSLSERVVENASRLMVISRHGVGYDNVPLALCSLKKIPVTVVGDVNSVSVAEHAMYLLLAAARLGVELDGAIREGRFAARFETFGVELYRKTLLLIGFGRIGKEVAHRALAFGMRVIVFDPYAVADGAVQVEFVQTLADGLSVANAVSLHVPLTPETRNLIGPDELAMLPRGAILVNSSRGGLVDEDALVAAVASGRLHAAGLDTFADEPVAVDSPLIAQRRIVLSPHSASLTEDALIAMGVATIENALAGLDGKLSAHSVVNPEVL